MTARGDCSARFFKVYFHYINLQRGDGQGLQEYISGVLLELREFGRPEGLDKNSGERLRLYPETGDADFELTPSACSWAW